MSQSVHRASLVAPINGRGFGTHLLEIGFLLLMMLDVLLGLADLILFADDASIVMNVVLENRLSLLQVHGDEVTSIIHGHLFGKLVQSAMLDQMSRIL